MYIDIQLLVPKDERLCWDWSLVATLTEEAASDKLVWEVTKTKTIFMLITFFTFDLFIFRPGRRQSSDERAVRHQKKRCSCASGNKKVKAKGRVVMGSELISESRRN